MPAAAQINDSLIRDNIARAVTDVFKTMLGREPQLTPFPGTDLEKVDSLHSPLAGNSRPHVVGTVGFIGDANGLIYLYLDLAFARHCTCQLLGMTESELNEAGDEVMNDAIGELTNMTVGSFKNGLCDAGYPCKLTIPSILHGSNFSIEPISSVSRYIYNFDCGGQRIIADVLIKQEE